MEELDFIRNAANRLLLTLAILVSLCATKVYATTPADLQVQTVFGVSPWVEGGTPPHGYIYYASINCITSSGDLYAETVACVSNRFGYASGWFRSDLGVDSTGSIPPSGKVLQVTVGVEVPRCSGFISVIPGKIGIHCDLIGFTPPSCAPTSATPSASLILLDPYLLVKTDQALANLDLSKLLAGANWSKIQANGLEADNTSAAIALVQTNTQDCVTFSTNNGTTLNPYTNNYLTAAPTPGLSTITVQAKELIQIGALFYAAVWVQAPAVGASFDFAAPITVSASQDAVKKQANLNLVTPPVLLVHGLWGNKISLQDQLDYLTSFPIWLLNLVDSSG